MRYVKAVNIWALSEAEIRLLQPGQWVYAGTPDNKGQFWGVRTHGTVVVAWYQNAKRHRDYHAYMKAVRDYASC